MRLIVAERKNKRGMKGAVFVYRFHQSRNRSVSSLLCFVYFLCFPALYKCDLTEREDFLLLFLNAILNTTRNLANDSAAGKSTLETNNIENFLISNRSSLSRVRCGVPYDRRHAIERRHDRLRCRSAIRIGCIVK